MPAANRWPLPLLCLVLLGMRSIACIAADLELENLEREYAALESSMQLPACTNAQLAAAGIKQTSIPPISLAEFETLRAANQKLAGTCQAQEIMPILSVLARLSEQDWQEIQSRPIGAQPCTGSQLKAALASNNMSSDMDLFTPRQFRDLASVARTLGQSCGLPREFWFLAFAIPKMSDTEMQALFGEAAKEYNERSNVTEGLSLASAAKTAVSEYFASTGGLPSNNGEAGLAAPTEISGQHVEKVEVLKGGDVEVTYRGGSIHHHTIVLRPTVADGRIEWACDGGTLATEFRPSSCRRAP